MVHDGFATVRRPHHYVGYKRRRAAAIAGGGGGVYLEPVTEHVVGGGEQQRFLGPRPKSSYTTAGGTTIAAALPSLPSDVPWWEIATRRRPKSCADFTITASDNNGDKVGVYIKIGFSSGSALRKSSPRLKRRGVSRETDYFFFFFIEESRKK